MCGFAGATGLTSAQGRLWYAKNRNPDFATRSAAVSIRFLQTLFLSVLVLAGASMGQSSRKSPPAHKSEDPLSLKRLFPKHSYFGKSARGMKFSHDGKFAAWLWRSYDERRHGNDLFIYDVAKEKVKRITSVTVMAPFQKVTREVEEDRIKKAKARLKMATRRS